MSILPRLIGRARVSLDILLSFRFRWIHNANADKPLPSPPVAAKRPFERVKHGRRWQDPYHWMRVNCDEAVQHLERENAYSEVFMADTRGLQRKLEMEMASRLKREASSPPERMGSWLYYTQVPEGKEYPVFCRKRHPAGEGASGLSWRRLTASVMGWEDNEQEEVLLDQNTLVEEFGYVQLGVCRVSGDHHLMAYTVDLSGKEVFTLYIKDLQTGRVMTEQRTDSVVSVEWAKNEHTFFYTVADDLLRPWRIFSRSLHSNEEDTLILEERDASRFLDVSRTKDWSFMTVNVNSKTSSEVYLVNAEDPGGCLQLVVGRKAGVQYFVEHHQGFLYVLTNGDLSSSGNHRGTGNYRLVRCPLEQLSSHHWQEIIGLEQGAFIEDMEVFERYLVLYQRQGGLPLVRVMELPLTIHDNARQQLRLRTLSLPQEVCTVIPGANEDFHSSVLRVSVSSPNLPETVLEYDLASGNHRVLQQDELVGNKFADNEQQHLAEPNRDIQHNPSADTPPTNVNDPINELSSQYICQQHRITSADGVSVPLTLVHSQKLQKDGQNPALLIGYGAYGTPLEVDWCSERLSLLDRGWVVAFSHVRGGGELGKTWHQEGQLLKKVNSFNDFVASAKFLVEDKYAHQSKLGALGISAGGLLVASVVNAYPSLFQAALLQVPFLDICNTLLDKDLPLSVHEYDEWGDPDDAVAFSNILSYSPYDNVKVGVPYPAILVKTGLLDTRVGYWEAAKWVAKVRECTNESSAKRILLKTSMDTGHFAEGGRFCHLKEKAFDYAFFIKMIG